MTRHIFKQTVDQLVDRRSAKAFGLASAGHMEMELVGKEVSPVDVQVLMKVDEV